jgi:repressor LexA
MKGLSSRQERILSFIREFIRKNGYPPTIREIGKAVGISSTSVVNYNLNVLQRRGYLVREREVSRGLRLVGESIGPFPDIVSIPLLGRIAAGEPIPIPESDFPSFGEETLELTRDIIKEEEGIYALQVKGESLIDALINDGDIVVMKHQKEAENGELVAVWLKEKGETTLKRLYLEGDRVRLQPANPFVEPIYVSPSDIEIQGKVIAVIRRLD